MAGLSQRGLAQMAGVPQSTLARIELAIVSPRVDTLERLLRAAGQTLTTEARLGAGVDRTVIRALLELTPTERIRLGASDSKAFMEFEREVRRRAGLPDISPELASRRASGVDELEMLSALREELDAARRR